MYEDHRRTTSCVQLQSEFFAVLRGCKLQGRTDKRSLDYNVKRTFDMIHCRPSIRVTSNTCTTNTHSRIHTHTRTGTSFVCRLCLCLSVALSLTRLLQTPLKRLKLADMLSPLHLPIIISSRTKASTFTSYQQQKSSVDFTTGPQIQSERERRGRGGKGRDDREVKRRDRGEE